MTQEPERAGIVISGGNVHIGALAQGSGARASQVVSQPAVDSDSAAGHEELADLMRDLLDVIRDHTGELTDDASAQAAAEKAAAEISTEIGKDNPSTSRLRQLLAKLAIAAGPVSEIAAAIITVERAITGT